MDWIVWDEDACTGCGLCQAVCLRRCLSAENGQVKAVTGPKTCSLCGHCLAVCPAGALTHQGMDEKNFPEVSAGDDLDPERFLAFVRARRSHRFFKDKKIPRPVLERLLEVVRYCPTGGNDQTVEVMVLGDQAVMRRLSALTVERYRLFVKELEEKNRRAEEAKEGPGPELEHAQVQLGKATRLLARWDQGLDPVLRDAPCVLIFHSSPRASTPKDNCVIAAHTVTIYARTLGLESCYIGLLDKAFWAYEPLRQSLYGLGLPQGHGLYSVLILGYPRYKFLRAVDRQPVKIIWL
jgi:nitroreductase/NAD-dependent dihydropyrimidine dehydrogenase PreA subunit